MATNILPSQIQSAGLDQNQVLAWNGSAFAAAITIAVGNSTVNTSINATSFSGTANNANNLGGTSLATLQGQITGNAATAYTNATSYADNKAANAYSNAISYANTAAANAYSNAITYSANASNLGNGTVAPARLGSGTANSTTILYGNGVFAPAPDSTNASSLTTGTINVSLLASYGTANSTTVLYGNSVWGPAPSSTNASALISGTVNVSLLASYGTANSTTILYGNSVWAPAPSSTNASALTTGVVNASLLASFGTANSSTILYGNSVWAAAPGAPVAGGNTIITTGNGSNQAITLSSGAIVANDIIVTFNGLRQTPNSYAVASGILYVIAPVNSDVVVQLAGGPTGPAGPYFPGGGNTIVTTGTGANQSVTLSSNAITSNDIIVTFNGLRQTPNSYIVTTGTLYVTAPANSDIVVQLAGGIQGATGATGPYFPGGGNTIITTGTGANQSVILSSNAIVANDIIVTFNGLRQTPNSYIVNTGTLYVTAPANSDVVVQLAGGIQGPAGAAGANGSPLIALVQQQYTANGTGTQFAVSGGYSAGAMTVYVNGVKQLETTDVITSSGANVVFNTAPPATAQIDIFGFTSLPEIGSNTSVVSQQFTANGTANSFIVSGGYTAGSMQVFVNGVKFVESSDVVTSSGTTVNFTTAPANGSIVDVFGQVSLPAVTANSLLLIGGTVSGTINVGSNVSITTTGINVGNSTVNSTINATVFAIGNSIVNTTINAISLATGNSTVNTTINSTSLAIGNSTVNTTINSTSIYVNGLVVALLTDPIVINDISSQFDGYKSVFNLMTDQTPVTTIVDSKDIDVNVNGLRLVPYVDTVTLPWLVEFDQQGDYRVSNNQIIIYNSPAVADRALIILRQVSKARQKRKYPYSANTISLGD